MIDTEFLHQLDRFSLLLNKKLTSNYVGERESRATGRGMIFKDHSIYAPGEDFRRIDWKVFGRTDRLYIKKFEEERNLTVHIVIDFSGSMQYGSKVSKIDYAGMLGVAFAYLALKNNEKFVLSTFSDNLEVFKPKKGLGHIASMVEFLNNKKPQGKTNLNFSIGSYKKLINSRSLVVLISDFLYPVEDISRSMSLFKKHELIAIQVLDESEFNLSLDGDFKLKDMESGELLRTFVTPLARKNYQNQLSEHISKVSEACASAGGDFSVVHTGKNVFDSLWEILSARGRTRKAR